MSTAPFRADHVGSLLRPAYLLEARTKASAGALAPAELEVIEDRAVRELVALLDAAQFVVSNDTSVMHLTGLVGTPVVAFFGATEPRIYGPRQPSPAEWSIVKRMLDKRRWMILPDGGLQIDARCAAANAAHCLLLGVDNPARAAGQIYNCVEDEHYTWRQLVEIIYRQAEQPGTRLRPMSPFLLSLVALTNRTVRELLEKPATLLV